MVKLSWHLHLFCCNSIRCFCHRVPSPSANKAVGGLLPWAGKAPDSCLCRALAVAAVAIFNILTQGMRQQGLSCGGGELPSAPACQGPQQSPALHLCGPKWVRTPWNTCPPGWLPVPQNSSWEVCALQPPPFSVAPTQARREPRLQRCPLRHKGAQSPLWQRFRERGTVRVPQKCNSSSGTCVGLCVVPSHDPTLRPEGTGSKHRF